MKNKNHYDTIIVGQGLAGTLLALKLKKANQSILLIDQNHKSAASKVAAGIINPITGRRLVKSWMIDELLPEAIQTYTEIEKELNTNFFHPVQINRAIADTGDQNQWVVRASYPELSTYMESDLIAETPEMNAPFGFGVLQPAYRVDLSKLIETGQRYFIEQELLLKEAFSFDDLTVQDDGISYKNTTAENIVFSEGHQISNNPFFDHVEMVLAKGEVLILKIPNWKTKHLHKNKLMYVPLGDDLFWVGASYEWYADDDQPSKVKKSELLEKIQHDLKTPFEIVDHIAAIRPTVKDRRPVLGVHPEHSRLYVFNGLGTKGASLGPYWANHMVEFISKGAKIRPEVDNQRFYR